jgi:hypothetical protein
MTTTGVCGALATIALAAGLVTAQDKPAGNAHASSPPAAAAPAGAPRPSAEIAQLKFFEGKWNCAGQMNASAFGPAHKTKASVMTHSDLDGFWVSGMVSGVKSAEDPLPIKGMFHQTWDTAGKQYLMLWVDNFGGWANETSPGWEGEKIVWTGEGWAGGAKMQTRDTFTKKGPQLVHGMEMNVSGQWTSMGEETCSPAATATATPAKKP